MLRAGSTPAPVWVDPGEPASREEILDALTRLRREAAVRLAELADEELFRPQGAAWSPAQHLRHLATSAAAVAKGMEITLPILWLLFGRAGRPSRSFAAIRAAYHDQLAAGGRASGRYLPAAEATGAEVGRRRGEVMAEWARSGERLLAVVARWHEHDLDRFRLPHPLLGRLTVREMLFFTVYHESHHLNRIGERRALVAGAAQSR